MSTFDAFTSARTAPAASLFSQLLGRLAAWNDRRVTVKMLDRLSDRELADIGLQRGDIARWARRG